MRKFVLVYLSLLTLTNCAQVPNVEVCATGVDYVGICEETLTGSQRTVPPREWKKEVLNKLTLSVDDFGKIKKFIKKMCAQNGCTKEQVNQKREADKYIKKIDRLTNHR